MHFQRSKMAGVRAVADSMGARTLKTPEQKSLEVPGMEKYCNV